MAREIYLDNSATTRVFDEVVAIMNKIYLDDYGNPSSRHNKGVEAEYHIKEAKDSLAKILKVNSKEIIFTSGGTESDNTALIGVANANKRQGNHLITSKVEHPAILQTMAYLETCGFEVTYLPVDKYGVVSPEDLEKAIRPETILVSIMHTNNEIGSLMPIKELGDVIKKTNAKTLFHVDAVQGFGKAKIYPKKMNIDLMSVSSHKIHGPKGVGFLYVNEKVKMLPYALGGGQQGGMRSGTENVPGIAGMVLAANKMYENLEADVTKLYELKQQLIEEILKIEGVHINGHTGSDSAPHIISVSVKGVRAEVLLHALEEKGIYVSSGSACASNKPAVSDTLTAIGLAKEFLDSTIRISMSVYTTKDDIDATIVAMNEIIPELRKYTRR